MTAGFIGDIVALIATIFLIVSAVVYIFLPRFLTALVNSFDKAFGQLRVKLHTSQSIRIRLFQQRIVCIDLFDLVVDVGIPAEYGHPISKGAMHSSTRPLLLRLFARLIAVRFVRTQIHCSPQPSTSFQLSIPVLTITNCTQSRSTLSICIQNQLLSAKAVVGHDVLVATQIKQFHVEFRFDAAGVGIAGVQLFFDQISFRSSLTNMAKFFGIAKCLQSRLTSDTKGPTNFKRLPSYIRCLISTLVVDIEDATLLIQRLQARVDNRNLAFGPCIALQGLARGVSCLIHDQPLMSLLTMSLHSGRRRLNSTVACDPAFIDDHNIRIDGLNVSPRLQDLSWVYNRLSERRNDSKPSSDRLPLPAVLTNSCKITVTAYDCTCAIDKVSAVVGHMSLTGQEIAGNETSMAQSRAIELSMSYSTITHEAQSHPIFDVTSAVASIKFSHQDSKFSRSIKFRVCRLILDFPIALADELRNALSLFSDVDSPSNQDSIQWKNEIDAEASDVVLVFRLPVFHADLAHIARLQADTVILVNRHQRLESASLQGFGLFGSTSAGCEDRSNPSITVLFDDYLHIGRISYAVGQPLQCCSIDVSWSIPFHMSLYIILQAIQSRMPQRSSTSSPPTSTNLDHFEFTTFSATMRFDEKAMIRLNSDHTSMKRSPNLTTMSFDPSAISVNGSDFMSCPNLTIQIEHQKPYPDVNIDFSELTLFFADDMAIGSVMEIIRRRWAALKIWQRSAPSLEPKGNRFRSKIPGTLEFRCVCLRASIIAAFFEENALERVQLFRRWIALGPDGRRANRKMALQYRNYTLSRVDSTMKGYSRSKSVPDDSSKSFFHGEANFENLDDPLVDKFRSLQFLAADKSKWSLATVHIAQFCMLLSPDSSLMTPSHIVQRMFNLDSTSNIPYKSDGSGDDFTDLWARNLRMSCDDAVVKLRDYCFPLLSARHILIHGQLILACLKSPEQFLTHRFIFLPLSNAQKIFVPVDLPDGSFVANKFYTNLHIETTGLELNYGQCQRAAIAAFTKALSKISDTGSSGRNVGPSLPWWDQLRYKIHGRIKFGGVGLIFRLLTSAVPYDNECICLRAEKWSMLSAKGRFTFGAHEVQINLDEGTLSRPTMFRPGLLLSCPHLRFVLQFEWICKNMDSSQHYIYHKHWQTKEYQFSSRTSRDLYESFRATDITTKIAIQCLSTDATDVQGPVNGPLISFWFNNIPWFKRFQQLMANPPNVCTVMPKVLVSPNRAIPYSKSGVSLSRLLLKVKVQIILKSSLLELITIPSNDQADVFASESEILGIQGFAQLVSFNADINVVPNAQCTVNGVPLKTFVWSKQKATVAVPSIELLVPIVSTCSDDDDQVKQRLAHPFSQTPFATGEGESDAIFFISADKCLYCSPSGGGKSGISALRREAEFTQYRPSSHMTFHETSFAINRDLSVSLNMNAEEHSIREFLQSHFGDMDPIIVDEDSIIHNENLDCISENDEQYKHDSETEDDSDDDSENQEHYIIVSGVRILWNNTIRASFNAWWSFLSSFGHSESDTLKDEKTTQSVEQMVPSKKRQFATSSSSTGPRMPSLIRPLHPATRLSSFELFQKLEARGTQEVPEETLPVNEVEAPRVSDEDVASLASQADSVPSDGQTRFVMRLEQPQIILQSVEVGCSIVISAHQAKVDVIAFPYTFHYQDSPTGLSSASRSSFGPALERKRSSYFESTRNGQCSTTGVHSVKPTFIYFKRVIRSRLEHAQLHVVANNIDIDSNAMEWIPLEDFPSGIDPSKGLDFDQNPRSNESAYLKSDGIFQRISEPTTLGFIYSYDVNMDTKDTGALEYQFEHRSTASETLKMDHDADDELDLPDHPLTLPVLSSSTKISIKKISFVMDSMQYKVLIGVIDQLVLSPVQRVWAVARALHASRRAASENSEVDSDPKDLQKVCQEAVEVHQNQRNMIIFRRCVSYEIHGATWTMITNSPDVHLHVQLGNLQGSHRYCIDEGRDIELGIKEFHISNLAPTAPWPGVVAPHSRWDVAKSSSELMVQVKTRILGNPLPSLVRSRPIPIHSFFDVKLFPLIIKVHAQHYTCTRNYFFPAKDDSSASTTSQLLHTQAESSEYPPLNPYACRLRRTVMKMRTPTLLTSRVFSPPTTSLFEAAPIQHTVQNVAYNFFKYFHISALEFHIYLRGSYIDLDDLHVVIAAFNVYGELWPWDKVLSTFEGHVQTSVLKQSKSLIKQKFSASVKSVAEKEHKIRDRFTAKYRQQTESDDDSKSNPP